MSQNRVAKRERHFDDFGLRNPQPFTKKEKKWAKKKVPPLIHRKHARFRNASVIEGKKNTLNGDACYDVGIKVYRFFGVFFFC